MTKYKLNNRFKFRVWDIEQQRMIYPEGSLYVTGSDWPHLAQRINYGDKWPTTDSGVSSAGCIESIIQQFTGLLDKNGKEIYEGDIVKYDGDNDLTYRKPGIISIGEYDTHAGEFNHYGVRVKRIDMENAYFGLSKEDKDYLIIGNIFENPEILA